jgi:iodotyrosine deiodinase
VATRETTFKPVPLEFARLDAEEALRRSQEFLELMETRRSVRHFSSEPVPYELIENAIRTAGTAPSGANQQPWTFVVVSDPEVKEQVREAAEHEEELLYKERASEQYLDALEPIGTDWIKPHITDAPYLIVVFEQGGAGMRTAGSTSTTTCASRSGSRSASCSRRCMRRAWRRSRTPPPRWDS